MNSSIIYVYLGIVMIIVLATTFYVRSIKSKLDTKVDAMFQLVQSLVNEVNQLKMGQHNVSKPKEVIELDINSSNKQETYSETSDNETSDSETSESDDEDNDDNDDNDSPHEVNTQNNMSIEPVEVNVEPVVVDVEPVEVDVEPVEVDVEPVEVDVEPVEIDVEPVEIDVEPVEVEVSINEEVKKVVIESAEQNYESFTVKELKELVSAKGGKITGKKKSELIEFLLS